MVPMSPRPVIAAMVLSVELIEVVDTSHLGPEAMHLIGARIVVVQVVSLVALRTRNWIIGLGA